MSIEMSIKMSVKMSMKMSIEMSIKMSIEMSAENPILGTQRYFVSREPNFRYTTILLKKMNANYRK